MDNNSLVLVLTCMTMFAMDCDNKEESKATHESRSTFANESGQPPNSERTLENENSRSDSNKVEVISHTARNQE